MGRPPSNGGPSFRFNQAEVVEMEAILQAHKIAMPAREVLVSLADKFSASPERSGKVTVQMKQVWNWFQNRRYAIRAKAAKSPGKLNVSPMPRDDSSMSRNVPQAPQSVAAPSATVRPLPQSPQNPPAPPVQSAGRSASDNSQMEYEAKSARDGAWYDVATFLSHRSLDTGDPEVLVRFAGFGPEEDEWINIRKNVRQRSLPCESSECVAVLPSDLILCFQEGKEQALYFDAHVLDAQRRRHDVRGCRCRFLVRYDHDQSEEIVALRKICRRPETDYRLQQLHAVNESASVNQTKTGANIHTGSTLRVYPPAEVPQTQKQHKVEPVMPAPPVEVAQKQYKVEPVMLTPPVEVTQKQYKVEPVVLTPTVEVPQKQCSVQPSLSNPPAKVLQTPHKVEPAVPVPSAEVPQMPHKIEPVVPTASAEVPQILHQVEPVVPAAPCTNAPDVNEIQLQQPVVPSPTNVPETSEVKFQQPKVPEILSTNNFGDSNVPPGNSAVTSDNARVTVVGNSNVPPENDAVMSDNDTCTVVENSNVPPENDAVMSDNDTGPVVENSNVPPENDAVMSDNDTVTVVGNSNVPPENDAVTIDNATETGTVVGNSDVSLEDADVTGDNATGTGIGNSAIPLENAAVTSDNGTGTVTVDDGQNMEEG